MRDFGLKLNAGAIILIDYEDLFYFFNIFYLRCQILTSETKINSVFFRYNNWLIY